MASNGGGALGGLFSGLVDGINMRRELQQAADQHDEYQQRLAMNDQKMQQEQHDSTMKAIADRINLEIGMGARPAAAPGMVEDTIPAAAQSGQPATAPALSAPTPAPNFTPANYSPAGGTLDTLRAAVSAPQDGAPAQAAPAVQQPAAAPSGTPGTYLRKIDKSRQVFVPNPDGTKSEYELLKPEEAMARNAQIQQAALTREKTGLVAANSAARQLELKLRNAGKAPDDIAKAYNIDNTNPMNVFLPEEIEKMRTALSASNKNDADAGLTLAQTPGAQATSDIKTQQAAAAKSTTPADWDTRVDKVIPPTGPTATLNARTKAQLRIDIQSGAGPETLTGRLKDASDQIGRTETSVATAKAEAPGKIDQAAQIARATAQINAQEKARGEVVQSQDAVNSADAVGQTIKNLLGKAAAGDSTAASQLKAMIPELTNSVQGIKRLAGGQMEQSPGSLLDRAQGYLGGIVDGKPIPDRVVKELPGVVDELTQTAHRAHNAGVDSRNQAYGTNFAHAADPNAPVNMKAPDGSVRPVPANQVEHYKALGATVVK